MDNSIILATDIVGTSGITLEIVLEIIRESLTILGLLGGLYYGRKGVKRYLLGDILKEKFLELHNSNKAVFAYTNSILELVKVKNIDVRHLSKEDLNEIKEITDKLVLESKGASSEVHTLAYYLNHTINNIEPTAKEGGYFEARLSHEFYSILGATCHRINSYANNVIDLPLYEGTKRYYDIKRKYRKFIGNAGYNRLKDYKFGLEISSSSELSLVFFNILDSNNVGYIFFRRYFSVLGDIHPLLVTLWAHKIYFPAILKSKTEVMLGYEYLHLIKYVIHNKSLQDGTTEKMVELFYSNILSRFGFVKGMESDRFLSEFEDGYLDTGDIYKNSVIDVVKKTDETISFKCNYADLDKLFKMNRWKFRSRMKDNLKNSQQRLQADSRAGEWKSKMMWSDKRNLQSDAFLGSSLSLRRWAA